MKRLDTSAALCAGLVSLASFASACKEEAPENAGDAADGCKSLTEALEKLEQGAEKRAEQTPGEDATAGDLQAYLEGRAKDLADFSAELGAIDLSARPDLAETREGLVMLARLEEKHRRALAASMAEVAKVEPRISAENEKAYEAQTALGKEAERLYADCKGKPGTCVTVLAALDAFKPPPLSPYDAATLKEGVLGIANACRDLAKSLEPVSQEPMAELLAAHAGACEATQRAFAAALDAVIDEQAAVFEAREHAEEAQSRLTAEIEAAGKVCSSSE